MASVIISSLSQILGGGSRTGSAGQREVILEPGPQFCSHVFGNPNSVKNCSSYSIETVKVGSKDAIKKSCKPSESSFTGTTRLASRSAVTPDSGSDLKVSWTDETRWRDDSSVIGNSCASEFGFPPPPAFKTKSLTMNQLQILKANSQCRKNPSTPAVDINGNCLEQAPSSINLNGGNENCHRAPSWPKLLKSIGESETGENWSAVGSCEKVKSRLNMMDLGLSSSNGIMEAVKADGGAGSRDVFPWMAQSSPSMNSVSHECCEDGLAEILGATDEAFRSKYSEWISSLLKLQMTKMCRRLTHYFKGKVQRMLDEKDSEVRAIRAQHKQDWSHSQKELQALRNTNAFLREENQKMNNVKTTLLEEIRKADEAIERKVELRAKELLSDQQTLFEQEKLAMQKEHSMQLSAMLDKSTRQIERVQAEYHGQIQALETQLLELRDQRDALDRKVRASQQNLTTSGLNNNNLTQVDSSAGYFIQPEVEQHLLATITDLQKRLCSMERERMTLEAKHSKEVDKLQTGMNAKDKELQLMHTEFQHFKSDHDQQTKRMMERYVLDDQRSQEIIAKLKNKLHNRIQQLTLMVERCQAEIQSRGAAPNTLDVFEADKH